MSIFDIFNSYSDEHFKKQLKKYDKEYGSHHLDFKLEMAYSHRSVLSAFWWYENCVKKPNTGSDKDIELLHAKFKCSLEKQYDDKRNITRERQIEFVNLVLPDIDYGKTGFHTKGDCVKKIMEDYEALRKRASCRHASPFITGSYYIVYNIDKLIGADGKPIFNENGKTAFYEWYDNFYKMLNDKYTTYGVIRFE